MTDPELADLLTRLRGAGTDFAGVEAKAAHGGLPKDIWQTVSAFANSGGGVLILGADERQQFNVVGVHQPKATLQRLAQLCHDEMRPSLSPLLAIHKVGPFQVLVAEIPAVPVEARPCFYAGKGIQKGSYLRVGDGNYQLNPYEVQLWIAGQHQPRDDTAVVDAATPDDLDSVRADALVQALRDREARYRALDVTGLLHLEGVLAHAHGTDRPTVAGLLALGRFPERWLPGLRGTFVVHPDVAPGRPGLGTPRFLDNRAHAGPVGVIASRLLADLRANLRAEHTIGPAGGRMEDLEVPLLALREAISNALVHRDLSPMGQSMAVTVEVFPDRIVIANPGGLYGSVSPARLGYERISSARNLTLMRLLEDLPDPDLGGRLCENRASGILTMNAALEQRGLPAAVFDTAYPSRFAVTFRRPVGRAQPADRRPAIIAALATGPKGRAELARRLGLTPSAVNVWLRRLRAEGTIEALGSERSPRRVYRLTRSTL